MDPSRKPLIDRSPVAAGRFYSAHANKLEIEIANMLNEAEKLSGFQHKKDEKLLALIAPHAGYVFSGVVAASAFMLLRNVTPRKRVFLLGSSHHTDFNGASIYNVGHYLTPFGKVKVDLELANKLIENSPVINYVSAAHAHEHSIEVMLPFIQYFWQNNFEIVPIVLATHSEAICRQIAEELKPYFTSENLFVVSTDLSHYPVYADAMKIDKETIEAVTTGKPEQLLEQIRHNKSLNIPNLSTSMCGWTSVLSLMYLCTNIDGIQYYPILYQNSGDAHMYGDTDRVVGYQSMVVTKLPRENNFDLNDKEKELLLNIAKSAIFRYKSKDNSPINDPQNLPSNLNKQAGAFVSIYVQNKLRGCIGQLQAGNKPLAEIVSDVAVSAAFRDSRFAPVTEEEMKNLHIEISVLTPLKRIASANEIILGKHGIYIKKENRSGTFLPQVANDTHWSVEEFLGNCSKNKAGLGWDGWKDAELYTYEAIVFSTPK
ncbi:MAG: AmmeMemoRadiSam system protein B [Bacteroidota bacterium]|nr:MAG: AmmeMemoRadiSam system protein B [Bacteroidota bacterium]